MMEFNPYGSFLDFSRHDWSLGDDNDNDGHDHEDVKSSKAKKDSTTKKQERPSSPPLPDVSDDTPNKEQQGPNGELSHKKSIRSEPATTVTAASTAPQEPFSFEITLPPGLDVSPLSCKESVVASMMSRSGDRTLQAPPAVIRAGPTTSQKFGRARSKSRGRKVAQDPPSNHEISEKGPLESHNRSDSQERTRAPSGERRAKRSDSKERTRAPSSERRAKRSDSKERTRAPSSERHAKRSDSKERTRAPSSERRAKRSDSKERTTAPSSERAKRSDSKERTTGRAPSSERRSKRRSRSRENTRQSGADEAKVSHSKDDSNRASSNERRALKTSQSKTVDPTSDLLPEKGSDHGRPRSSSNERRSRRHVRTESMDPKSQAPVENYAGSQLKESEKPSTTMTQPGPMSRSQSIGPSRRSTRDSDNERRRRTRSISTSRIKQDDPGKLSQSMVRVNPMEEIGEQESDHSTSGRGRQRSPSNTRDSSKSMSQPQDPSLVDSQSSQEQKRESTSFSRSRSKSRSRASDIVSSRNILSRTWSERNLTTLEELTEITESVEDVPPPPPPPPPPPSPPTRRNPLSSPRRLGKEGDGRRSSRALSPRPGSTHSSEDIKRIASPGTRRHKSIHSSNEKPDASPKSRLVGGRRRVSRRSTDPAAETGDSKRSHFSKWNELRQMNEVQRPDDSDSKDPIVQKEVDVERTDVAKQTKEDSSTDILLDSATTLNKSDSHQMDVAGNASGGGKLTGDHAGAKGLVDVQPKLQNVMIRPKQPNGTVDVGTTDMHTKPPASPALSASRNRKTLQKSSANHSSPRGGRRAGGNEKRGSHDADSENGSTSQSPSLASKLNESKRAVSGKTSATSTGSRADSESEFSQSLASGGPSRLQNEKTFNNWQMSGTNELISNHSTDTFLMDNDAILVAPKITPVILHGNHIATATTSTSNSLKKGSPNQTHKAIAKISEHSDSAASLDRLKRASELIEAQKRKKEASRSRQKALEGRSLSSQSIEQSPTPKRGADLATSKSETAAISSPRGWGLLKSMRGASSRLLTAGLFPPPADLEDKSSHQDDPSKSVDQATNRVALKGATEFVKATSTRVSSRRESRRRSQNEEGAEPRKASSSKWKDLSRRLQAKEMATSSKELDPPGGKEQGLGTTGTMGDSPDRPSQRRVSKWTGLKGARAFIAGRHSEPHKVLLSDDGLI